MGAAGVEVNIFAIKSAVSRLFFVYILLVGRITLSSSLMLCVWWLRLAGVGWNGLCEGLECGASTRQDQENSIPREEWEYAGNSLNPDFNADYSNQI